MDESSSMTLTSTVLIVFCLIVFGLILYRYFLYRQTLWTRTYKEEKIGLSAHKLFKPNGYMIHSGSELLLSSSGSFKRFDTVDKDSCKQTQLQNSPKHSTTPLWNLPQTDSEIPPQPLRPAPAPAPSAPVTNTTTATGTNHTKTVTFSLQLTEEKPLFLSRPNTILPLVSPKETYTIPPLEAPPKPKSTPNGGVTMMPTTAIPRPVAKKSPQLNGYAMADNPNSFKGSVDAERPVTQWASHTLANSNSNSNTNTNSSTINTTNTNPFLDNLYRTHSNTALTNPLTTNQNLQTSTANPFLEQRNDSYRTKPFLNAELKCQSENPIYTFRSRSYSQAEVGDRDKDAVSMSLKNLANVFHNPTQPTFNAGNPFSRVARKIKGPHMLQKTISEDFLFRKFGYGLGNASTGSGPPSVTDDGGNSTWNFKSLWMQEETPFSLWRRNSSQSSLNSASLSSLDGGNLERAVSCESVDSDYASLDYNNDCDQSTYTQITGYLCVGLQYEKNPMSDDGVDLQVNILEAKGLLLPFRVSSIDTFVRVYLVPDQTGSLQTKIVEDCATPTYNDALHFWLKKAYPRHSLWFHLFHNGEAHTLIGEAEMEIGELPKPTTTWIPLTDSRKLNAQWGEIMFSLSYLPTAERITIVVVKARNLQLRVPSKRNPEIMHDVQNIFVKVYLMNNDKKVLKKRTSLKRKDRCPVFNEFVIFSLPPQSLTTAQIRFTVYGVIDEATITPLGHVVAGSSASGKGLRHWHQMLSSLRKPVAMWHVLRRGTHHPAIAGGTDVLPASNAAAMRASFQCAKRNSVF